MAQNIISHETNNMEQKPLSRIRAWGLLIFFSMLIWAFGAIIGPWITDNVQLVGQIVQVIEENDINANAYFYTEIAATDEAEGYLIANIEFAKHRDAKFNLVFMSGIAFCFIILALGFRYLPND